MACMFGAVMGCGTPSYARHVVPSALWRNTTNQKSALPSAGFHHQPPVFCPRIAMVTAAYFRSRHIWRHASILHGVYKRFQPFLTGRSGYISNTDGSRRHTHLQPVDSEPRVKHKLLRLQSGIVHGARLARFSSHGDCLLTHGEPTLPSPISN